MAFHANSTDFDADLEALSGLNLVFWVGETICRVHDCCVGFGDGDGDGLGLGLGDGDGDGLGFGDGEATGTGARLGIGLGLGCSISVEMSFGFADSPLNLLTSDSIMPSSSSDV